MFSSTHQELCSEDDYFTVIIRVLIVIQALILYQTVIQCYIDLLFSVILNCYLVLCWTVIQGFSVEGQENIQEILSKQLYLCQFLVAISILRPGISGISFVYVVLLYLLTEEKLMDFNYTLRTCKM